MVCRLASATVMSKRAKSNRQNQALRCTSIWLDLTEEPLVVSVPDTEGRYYLFPMLDMWTDVFASPGWRTTGTEAANYLVTPPGWTGAVPDGMLRGRRIRTPG